MNQPIRSRIALICFIVFACRSSYALDPPESPVKKKPDDLRTIVESKVANLVADRPGIGVVVGVWMADGPHAGRHVFGMGKVRIDNKDVSPDGDTIFEIGSITKAYTGTLLAELVRSKIVKLDDPAQQYLPAELQLPRRDERDITLLHLATHTSSLPRLPATFGLVAMTKPSGMANPYKDLTISDLATMLKATKLQKPIGSEEAYSNLGVGLLGMALANATKAQGYEQVLTEKLLKPLQLQDTKFALTDNDRIQRLAPGHRADGEPASNWDMNCLAACGGLRSTANDVLAFGRAALAIDDHAPLTAAFRFAQQPWRERKQSKQSFVGLCWVREPSPSKDHTLIWHNGGTGGYRSFLGIVPERKLVVVVLINMARSVDAEAIPIIKHLEQSES